MTSEIDDEISNHDVITDDSEMDIDKPVPGETNSMPLWLKGKIPEDWVWFFSMWVDMISLFFYTWLEHVEWLQLSAE